MHLTILIYRYSHSAPGCLQPDGVQYANDVRVTQIPKGLCQESEHLRQHRRLRNGKRVSGYGIRRGESTEDSE